MTQALPESTLLPPLNYRLGATLTIRLHKLNQILHTHSINLGGLLLVVFLKRWLTLNHLKRKKVGHVLLTI